MRTEDMSPHPLPSPLWQFIRNIIVHLVTRPVTDRHVSQAQRGKTGKRVSSGKASANQIPRKICAVGDVDSFFSCVWKERLQISPEHLKQEPQTTQGCFDHIFRNDISIAQNATVNKRNAKRGKKALTVH